MALKFVYNPHFNSLFAYNVFNYTYNMAACFNLSVQWRHCVSCIDKSITLKTIEMMCELKAAYSEV